MIARTQVAGSREPAEALDTADAAHPGGLWALTTMPVAVWIAVVLHGCLLLVGSVAMPLLSVPDEQHHADMVFAVSQGMGWPEPGTRLIGPEMSAASRLLRQEPRTQANAVPRSSPVSGPACTGRGLPECVQRPTARDLQQLDLQATRVNRATQHPPLYYAVVAGVGNAVTAVLPTSGPLTIDDQLWIYRVVSAAMVLPVPLIGALIARQLGGNRAAQSVASLVFLLTPSFYLRTGPMINNDAPTILLTSLLSLLLIRIVRHGWRRFDWIFIGVVTGLALLMKGLAIPLIALVGLAFALVAVRNRGLRRQDLVQGGASVALMFVVGAWWWLKNLLVLGRLQPLVFEPENPAPQSLTSLPDWAETWFVNVFRSFWGSWFVRPYSPIFWLLIATVALTVVLVLTLRTLRTEILLVTALNALLISGVALVSMNRFLESGLVKGDQGRYLFPALAATGAICAVAWVTRTSRWIAGRWIGVGVLLLAAALHARSWAPFLRTQWGARGASLGNRWEALLAWSPVRPSLVLVFLTGAVVSAIALAVSLAMQDRGHGNALRDRSPGRPSHEGRLTGPHGASR